LTRLDRADNLAGHILGPARTPLLVSLSNVSFGYASDEIFRGLTLQVNAREHLGVVGPNGHGKSTLLRLIAGTLAPESGERSVRRGVDVGYLRQSQEFPDDTTVHDLLLTAFPEILETERKLDAVHAQMEAGDGSDETLQEYGELQHRFEELEGYALESRADALAAELGFGPDDLARMAGSLSGGERARLELARVLLREPDLLLLDEPTNHLDLWQTERLERRLAEFPYSFLLVSHDRAFLRATCDGIVEVERQGATRFRGGYESYRRQRGARLRRALDDYVRQNERIEKTEDFIRRNIAGQKTKQAQARRKMLERLERVERPQDVWEAARHLGIRFEEGEHPGGREMIRARGLTIGFEGKEPLIRDLDWTVYRGDRVGVVGPNGAGKTSLVLALLGRSRPLDGNAELGYQASPGYLDQKLQLGLHLGRSLLDEVRSLRPDLTIEDARSELGRYRFLGDEVFKTVGGLSGGERCRLSLLKVALMPHNLLVLDEPTNHLDIPACEVLEDALCEYGGTLLVTSHDREFLDNVVSKILWVEDGHVREFDGNYSRARKKFAGEAEESVAVDRPPAPSERSEPKRGSARREESKKRRRERQRAQNRLEKLEKDIAEFEARSKELQELLAADPAGDWERLHALANEEQELRARLDRRYAEWERVTDQLGED
jgi:ATP-binding cassette subfamily F protein 3